MSMSVLSAIQCLWAFFAYSFITIILPAVVLGKKFENRSFLERFMIYFTIGNFYVMNLVFVLELLHISYKITLILGTVIPSIVVYCKINGISLKKKFNDWWKLFDKIIHGHIGVKTVLYRAGGGIGRLFKRFLRKFKEIVLFNIIDWILIAGLTILYLKLFASNILVNYGYTASDIPVHNYWINYLGSNQIFVAGIYPFGFHCIIYYIHELFNMDTYVLLRIFCAVQTFYVNLMILTLLKGCCKTKFAPYIGWFCYMALDIYATNTYSRFTATLPQEFGMIFIYPCAYFAFEFFRKRKEELNREKKLFGKYRERRQNIKEERKQRKEAKKSGEKVKKKYYKLRVRECYSTWYLAGFAMNFAMTLSVHFYDTMIAGLFAVGLAVGFFFRFIRPKYFWRVVLTCAISVFAAVLPMAIAFAMGTPLQGSLGWGMNILAGGNGKEAPSDNGEMTLVTTQDAVELGLTNGESVDVSGAATQASGQSADVSGAAASSDAIIVSGENMYVSGGVVYIVEHKPQPIYFNRIGFVKMKKIVENGKLNLISQGNHYFYNTEELKYKRSLSFYIKLLINDPNRFVSKLKYKAQLDIKHVIDSTAQKVFTVFSEEQVKYGYIIALMLAGVGILLIICRQPDYGAAIVSIVAFGLCMALLLASGRIGLPTLMDSARASIYFAYMVPLIAALLVDSCIFIVSGWLKWKWVRWIKHFISLACCIIIVLFSFDNDLIKKPRYAAGSELYVAGLEMNEAITCLTNIIWEEKDFTWTICSANDETRMVDGHGFHYETITFLREMEKLKSDTMVTMPTETVYFFIEKVPLDYAGVYEGSGQKVSQEGARKSLPRGNGLSVYQLENRWIVMSRMYYWAQEFSKLYPNEMKVYLETDNFVCYKIKQNTYRLYNFAIDYGYNRVVTDDEEDEEVEAENGIT